MDVWFAQTNGQNVNDSDQWKNAAGDTMTTVLGSFAPASGDILTANGKTGIVINANIDIGTGRLSTADEDAGGAGGAGGGFTFSGSAPGSITANIVAGTTTCLTCNHTGVGANRLVVNGTVTASSTTNSAHGITNSAAGEISTGQAVGGSGNGLRYGISNESTGTLNISVGSGDAAIGGTGASNNYAIRCASSCTLNITGNVTAQASSAFYLGNLTAVNITGDVTASAVSAITNTTGGTTTVNNGTITGGSVATAIGIYNPGGAIIMNNCTALFRVGAAFMGRAITFVPGTGNYIEFAYNATPNYYRYAKTIPAASVLVGVNGDGAGAPVTGTYHAPENYEVIAGATFGPLSAISGNVQPAIEALVLTGTAYGSAGTQYHGALTVPDAAQVLTDVVYGPNGTALTGTLSAGGGALVGPSALISG